MMSNTEASPIEKSGSRLQLRLSNLKVFQLSKHQDVSNLTHIDLRNNRLAQLPDQICELTKLVELKVDYNFLHSLPHGIDKLTNLEYLSASQNTLKSIPSNIVYLYPTLRTLVLNDNKLTQIQQKIGNLVNLEVLLLHHNMIVDVPSSLYRLRELTQLSLDWFSYLNSEYVGVHTKHLKSKLETEKCS